MKKLVRGSLRKFGIDISRYNPANSPELQTVSALKLISADTVFDVGANTGQFAGDLRSHGFTGKIISFEPLSSAHKLLENRAARDPFWLVHPQAAIGDKVSNITINISGNSVSSSILPMLDAHSNAASASKYVGAENVRMITLDSVVQNYVSQSSSLFLKIDTQGYEWNVLNGAENTIKLAKGILLELSLVELYEGQHLWLDLIRRLEGYGFVTWALQKGFTDPNSGRTLQMDAIFIRS